MHFSRFGLSVTIALTAALATPALAQTPKRGGTLPFAIVAEPPTTDCHSTGTFAMVHPVAPQYSTLLKFVGDYANQKIVGDLAESWEMAKDGLTYTFKLHKGVKFHDGSPISRRPTSRRRTIGSSIRGRASFPTVRRCMPTSRRS